MNSDRVLSGVDSDRVLSGVDSDRVHTLIVTKGGLAEGYTTGVYGKLACSFCSYRSVVATLSI